MEFISEMPYKGRGKGYRKRRSSKRGRYGSKHARRGKFARKVLNIVLNKDAPTQTAKTITYAGICSGLAGAKTTPSPNRCVLWGRWDWKNQANMYELIDTIDDFAAPSALKKIWVKSYVEKHTLQNACLFPVCITVYEFYFQSDMAPSQGANDITYPTIAGEEQGLYATTLPVYNFPAAQTISTYVPLYIISKYNYYEGRESSATLSTGTRSFLDIGTSGAGTHGQVGIFNRPYGMMSFKTRNMGDEIKLKKRKIVTLGPGQQFNISYIKKNKWLDAEDILNNTTRIQKGGGGFLFYATGYMSHDADQSALLNAVNRSSFVVNHEIQRTISYKLNQYYDTREFKSNQLTTPVPTIVNERRAGLATTEYAVG